VALAVERSAVKLATPRGVSMREFVAARTHRTDGCWLWTGRRDRAGYGKIRRGPSAKNLRAHRVAWELEHGPIPDGLCVLHHCDNPSCVRPDHLFLGTDADNVADMFAKGRSPSRVGEGNGRVKLTWAKVAEIRAAPTSRGVLHRLAQQYGVSWWTIRDIRCGRRWQEMSA